MTFHVLSNAAISQMTLIRYEWSRRERSAYFCIIFSIGLLGWSRSGTQTYGHRDVHNKNGDECPWQVIGHDVTTHVIHCSNAHNHRATYTCTCVNIYIYIYIHTYIMQLQLVDNPVKCRSIFDAAMYSCCGHRAQCGVLRPASRLTYFISRNALCGAVGFRGWMVAASNRQTVYAPCSSIETMSPYYIYIYIYISA